jgi:hypothetical protein
VKWIVIAALVSLFVAPDAFAQQIIAEPDATKVHVRIGPLWLNPAITLSNLGFDDNVFNEQATPKKDFTFTITPRTDLWLGIGRTWLRGSIDEDLIWYQTYSSERSANTAYTVSWMMTFSRLSINAAASHSNTRERPTAEIDTRAPRKDNGVSAGASYKIFSKTSLGFTASRRSVAFDDTAQFFNVSLSEALSRTSLVNAVSITHAVTPITSLSVEVAREHVQFGHSPDRDTHSSIVNARVSLDPFAVIKGSATFGFRRFEPVSSEVPGFTGTTASLDLSYAGTGSTRITARVMRDVQYSYDVLQPYYVQTGFSLEVLQQVFGPVDIALRVGANRLAYRDRIGTSLTASNRTDHVQSFGGGVGYHLGTDIRIAGNVDQFRRSSPVTGHAYDGIKTGMSVTYLF